MKQRPSNSLISSWDDTRSIIITTHHPDWTWEALHAHEASVITPMLRAANLPVALITDMRSASYFDPIDTITHVRRTSELHRTQPVEMVVFVLRDPSIAMLLKAMYQRHGASEVLYLSARTLSEAYMLINKHRKHANNIITGKFKNSGRNRLAGD